MANTEENSVMFALSELQKLESDRQEEGVRRRAEEAAARLEAEQAEARRVADEKAKAERVAQAEARLRVNAELEARDADAERRLVGLRTQLEAVQAERARLHASIVMSADEMRAPTNTHSGRGWAFAFSSMSLVAGMLGALLFMQPEPQVIEVPAIEVLSTPIVAAEPEPEPEVVAPLVAEVEVPEEQPAVATPRQARNPRTVRVRQVDREDRVFEALEACGDDPTCGLGMN